MSNSNENLAFMCDYTFCKLANGFKFDYAFFLSSFLVLKLASFGSHAADGSTIDSDDR